MPDCTFPTHYNIYVRYMKILDQDWILPLNPIVIIWSSHRYTYMAIGSFVVHHQMSETKFHFPTCIPVQKFLCNPIVIESICYRTKANQLKSESNTTERLIKIWKGNTYCQDMVHVCTLIVQIHVDCCRAKSSGYSTNFFPTIQSY